MVPTLTPGSTVSHLSAAVLLGLPVWGNPLDRIHVTRPIASGANRSAGVHVHAAAREDVPTMTVDGIAVTSPALTVVDVARSVPFEQGVVVADAALHAKLVTPEQLAAQLEGVAGRTGAGRARAVVAFADGRSESVGESRSRVVLARAGLPAFDLQIEIQDERGFDLARCDFGYTELLIAGEFDGEVKYGRLLRPGQTPGDVVFDEKRREDALRDLGWIVVRWVWAELAKPEVIVARWERALERAKRRR